MRRILCLLLVVFFSIPVFAQEEEAQTRGLFKRGKPVIMVMDFRDYSGDPALKGLTVAVPNEIGGIIKKNCDLEVRRWCELPADLVPQQKATNVGVPGTSLTVDISPVIKWLKGYKLKGIIDGDYAKLGKKLTLTARYLDPKTYTVMYEPIVIHGTPDDASLLAEKMAKAILSKWGCGGEEGKPGGLKLPDLPDVPNGNLDMPKVGNLPDAGKILANVDAMQILKQLDQALPDKNIKLTLEMDKKVYKIGEKARIRFKANKDGYLTLIDIGTSGKAHVIFPNAHQVNNHIKADKTYLIPSFEHEDYLFVDAPGGKEQVIALFTLEPSSLVFPDTSSLFTSVPTRDLKVLPKKISGFKWNKAEYKFTIK